MSSYFSGFFFQIIRKDCKINCLHVLIIKQIITLLYQLDIFVMTLHLLKILMVNHFISVFLTCFSYHLNRVFRRDWRLYSATICREFNNWNTMDIKLMIQILSSDKYWLCWMACCKFGTIGKISRDPDEIQANDQPYTSSRKLLLTRELLTTLWKVRWVIYHENISY